MRQLTLLTLSLAILLSACSLPFGGPPPVPPGAPAAATAVGVSLPPEWTPTPTDRAQMTSPPTSQPRVEATATASLEVSALRLSELPIGFVPAQPISYGLRPAALAAGVLTVQAIAFFEQPNSGVLVFSVASRLASPSEEQAVALGIETPTTPVAVLAGALGQVEGTPRLLDGFEDIGTASAAAEGRLVFRDFRYDLQLVLLRQGAIAAYIAVMTPLGTRPGFDLNELARAYAARVRLTNLVDAPTVPSP
ncbi:MAG: hypothetical protein FJZ97_04530 [Chloroflexi bacterium]|nr:hypothetical protein [Chloroflexota bacterium]